MDDVAQRFEDARARGIERFDPPRARFIARLLERAEGEARERLETRAAERLDALLARFEAARTEARAAIERVEAAGLPTAALHEAYGRGELRAVMQRCKRLRGRRCAEQTSRLRERLEARTTLVGAPAPDTLAGAPAPELVLAEAAYAERRGDALARRAIDALRESVPPESGPYHPPTVVAQTLDTLASLHPPLLRAWLQRLENLGALRTD